MHRSMMAAIGVACCTGLVLAAGEPPVADGQAPPPPQQTQQKPTELYATLNNPGSHPKIGFQAMSYSDTRPEVRNAAETILNVLAADLEFEREYYVIDRKASAGIPAAATPQTLPFSRWSELGADLVLMTSLREIAGAVTVEVRLITIKADPGFQDFGQSYGGCTLAKPRHCAHAIADDIHKKKRNLDGVARTRIAFTSDRADESAKGRPIADGGTGKEIYIMDYDGDGQQRLTFNRNLNIGANWGPEGRMLAYASFPAVSGPPDILLTLLDGRPATRPARGPDWATNHSPAISPDGSRIAFTSNQGGQTGYVDVWVVNRDGTGLKNLTPNTPTSQEGAPTWSPNGNQIAFTSDRTGTNQVFIMNADGTGVTRITFAEKCDRPTWSTKDFIAYTLEKPGGKDIAITDLSRREARVLTDGMASNEQPTVSPNGRHIAFVTSRFGKRQIAVVDYDGKNYRQLTSAGNNSYPSWSPLPGR